MKTKKIDHSILHDNLNKPLMPNEEKRIHRKRMIILIVSTLIAIIALVAMILVLVLVKKN